MAPPKLPATNDVRPLRLIGSWRDEVADSCGALALGAPRLRRLGLGAESTRLEALFDVVADVGDGLPLALDYSESEGAVPWPWPSSCS
jgi:hypothetical protein